MVLLGGGGAAARLPFAIAIGAIALGLTAAAGSQALQRRADGAAYGGPSPLLVFAAAFFLTLVAGFVLGAFNPGLDESAAVLVSVAVSAVVSLGLVALLVVSPGALSWGRMGWRLPAPEEGSVVGDVAWGVVLAVPVLLVGGLLAAVLVAVLGVAPEPVIQPGRGAAGLALTLFAAAVVAPLWEEGFFRGFVTTAWSITDGPAAAILRGGLFFALVHVLTMSGSDFGAALRVAFITFVVRLPVALTLGWVFLQRRTLVGPIALHATYNAIPVILVALGGGAGT